MVADHSLSLVAGAVGCVGVASTALSHGVESHNWSLAPTTVAAAILGVVLVVLFGLGAWAVLDRSSDGLLGLTYLFAALSIPWLYRTYHLPGMAVTAAGVVALAICNGLRAKRHKDTHGLVTTFAVGVILLVGLVVHLSPSAGRPVTWWQDHVAPVDLVTTQRTSDGKADVATYHLAAGAWGSDEYYVVTHRRLIGLVEQRRLIAVIPSNMPDAQWADSRTVEVNGILVDAWRGSLVESR